ncbi:MAG: alpha/beta hydrolase [Proteobacteria bacterium]|nr:alpha/beta hydrolase [Pseudomonadota bacterium]
MAGRVLPAGYRLAGRRAGAQVVSAGSLLAGFEDETIDTDEARIHLRHGGTGPPLLLLHGYPQTHVAWHRVAPVLARSFTLVMPDLRGYGDSSCPLDDPEHRSYAKRTMARDMVFIMQRLGHRQFAVMGHDRGARVGYRMALDFPEVVTRLVLVDILTTWDQCRPDLDAIRQRTLSWAFLAQPAPLPESLIGQNPQEWLESRFRRGTASRTLEAFDPAALAIYYDSFRDADRIHASCEDYRAGPTADFADDAADLAAGRRIGVPTLLVWGTKGRLAEVCDPLALWQPWCDDLSGVALESGHYIPEENPEGLLAAALPFLEPTKVPT